MESPELTEAKYLQTATLYLEYLQAGNATAILSLFDAQATVLSPLYGQRSAEEFYQTLFEDTQKSETRILDLMTNTRNKSLALYFNYQWWLAKGEMVSFDVVDLFRFNHDHKIVTLHIIYDTHPIRSRDS